MPAAQSVEHFGLGTATEFLRSATKPNKMRKNLDNFGANREDRTTLMHRFTPLKTDLQNSKVTARQLSPLLLVIMLLGYGCKSSEPITGRNVFAAAVPQRHGDSRGGPFAFLHGSD